LRKNTTVLKTFTLSIPTTPYPFSANLDVSGVTINYGDVLFVQYENNITQVQITGGWINISYSVTTPFDYDTYSDAVINN
jgi:hypothetical protein